MSHSVEDAPINPCSFVVNPHSALLSNIDTSISWRLLQLAGTAGNIAIH